MDLQKGIKNFGSLYLACNDRKAFFTSSDQSRYTLWSCQNVCDALSYLLDNIYIRFGTKFYRQIVGIPMGTNCAPLVADLFLYCYERDFMDSLNHDNQADVIEAFNSTSRYLDDLLNIDNPYFEGTVNQIYPSEQQLNKKVQVGKDQEMAQSAKDSHSKRQYLGYRSPLFRSTSFCCKWICFFLNLW